MTDFRKNKKHSYTHGMLFKLGAVALLVFLLWLAVANIKLYTKKRQLTLQIQRLQTKIGEAKKQNEVLAESIENEDDPDYIEKVAREELDLQKPGETVVSFIEKKDENLEKNNASSGIWQKFLGSISGALKFLNPF